jgi:hypothetical protein
MKQVMITGLLLALAVGPVWADSDPEMEREERLALEREQAAERARQAELAQMKRDAQAKYDAAVVADKRKRLGAAANGKSDAEVNRMFEADQAQKRAEAETAMREGFGAGTAGGAMVKQMTGHSLEDMQNMSEEELEAMAKELEAKYPQ